VTLAYIVLYLTSHSCQNSLKEQLNCVLLSIYLPTTSSILYSLQIPNIIPLKLLCIRSWSYYQRNESKSLVSHFLTYLVLLILYDYVLLERLSSWFGVSSTALSWIKSYLFIVTACWWRRPLADGIKALNHLYSNSFMEFLNDPSLVLYSSSYTS